MPAAVRTLTNTALLIGGPRDEPDYVGPVPQRFSRKHPAPILQVQHVGYEWETPDIAQWQRVKLSQDGADDTMTIAIPGLHTARGSNEHFSRLLHKFGPNNLVRLLAPCGTGNERIIFQGYPQPVTLSWSKDHNSMSISCLSEAQERLRTTPGCQVLGRWMRQNPNSEWDSAAPKIQEVERFEVVFNAGGKPNRTADALRFGEFEGEPGGEGGETENRPEIYLFTTDNAPGAQLWTYAQALRYVAYFYIKRTGVPVRVEEFLADTPTLGEGSWGPELYIDGDDPFKRRITAYCPDVSIQSLNAEEAIATLCRRAGLHYHLPVQGVGSTESLVARFYLRIHATVGNFAESQDGVIQKRHMREGKVFDLPRERPFTDHTGRDAQAVAEANKAVQANITIDPRSYNRIIARGGPVTYEVTLLLRPGWMPHAHLDNLESASSLAQETAMDWWAAEFDPEYDIDRLPVSIYHGQHADNHTVADVFRLWVFPDSTEYVNRDLERSLYGEDWYTPYLNKADPLLGLVYAHAARGGNLSGSTTLKWVPVRRPFRNTIGRADLAVSDTSPIVQVLFGHTGGPETALAADGWVKYVGQPYIDTERATVRIVEDNIFKGLPLLVDPDDTGDDWATAIGRYIKGQFYLSVTCTIEADERMRYRTFRRSPTWRQRTKVMDYGLTRFLERWQSQGNSHLFGLHDDPDPVYQPRDDRNALRNVARRDLEHLSGDVVSGNPEIFWIDQTYWPGDSFSGISGLAVGFTNYPSVERVEYINRGGGYRTTLHLSDLRDSPEVDSE